MSRLAWTPNILWPDYVWPRPMKKIIAGAAPPTPSTPGPTVRRIWGFVHELLSSFSERYYCRWFGIPFNPQFVQLPFGLLIKWTDRTSLGEVAAMKMARNGGLPVPLVLSCGEHSEYRHFSILMTRLPGTCLDNSWDIFDAQAEDPWVHELKKCVESMRMWMPPRSKENCISSVIGSSIVSTRVPNHIMGPFQNETAFHEYLLSASSAHGFKSREEYENALLRAKKIQNRKHRIVFTHGDFKAHNILINDEGHLSGFLDWESGGWCPEYWEYTTAMRFGKDTWWYQVCMWMGGNRYLEELDADIALNLLTVDSYIFM